MINCLLHRLDEHRRAQDKRFNHVILFAFRVASWKKKSSSTSTKGYEGL